MKEVYQDVEKNLSRWSHHKEGPNSPLQEVLMIVPTLTADPDTPEATSLTRFTWDSDTTSVQGCAYRVDPVDRVPGFFDYPTPVLEKRDRTGYPV